MKSFSYIYVTAGATYLDIDAYASMVAMAELLRLQGISAVAWSNAPCNYSVCPSLVKEGQVQKTLPSPDCAENAKYIIVDVSDPDYLEKSVRLDQVTAVYDHHVGFEAYWEERIGDHAHIEFIGAAATLIYREWVTAGLQDQMTDSTARLLIAAILDNTLNLTSANTTFEDIEVFRALCEYANVDESWCAAYFSEVQQSVEADLKNAIFGDVKRVTDNPILPPCVAQLCVWDADSILKKLFQIRKWFDNQDDWMLNIIDIKNRCSYFVCDTPHYQDKIGSIFGAQFENGVAKMSVSYLRKEIIKKTLCNQ